ncbi:MAG: indole-3-glycerol phosphate synthase TrpC [Varibaculum sp.]|nr:indole-3-glycerol phosphate synthase TrpC [Varibaculum sp.]
MNVIEQIAARRRLDIAERRGRKPLEQLRSEVVELCEKPDCSIPSFRQALTVRGVSLICEAKKASPSKGLICPDFPYLDIARDYERGGAAAISVLTEPEYFQGRDEYLQEIGREVTIPLLRKDFVVDEYQIYEARLLGASAVLLIVMLLDETTLRRYLDIVAQVGMAALVEAHDEKEVETALAAGAQIIGVNNRDLRTFEIDFSNTVRLRSLVPPEVLFVGESGVQNRADVESLESVGVDGVLIGERLMRAADRVAAIHELLGR